MENYLWIGFIGAVLALLFAAIQRKKVMSYSEGNATMQKIAQSIREGANAYLKHQYSTVAKVFAVVFVVLVIIAFASGGEMLSKFTPFAFLTGGIWSMLAGLIGMKIATNSNARTAQAASESLNRGLRVAFSSGAVMGFTVVGLGMLDISIWLMILHFGAGITDPVQLGNIIVMNGIGASFMALFARVGGGIYTKAADVGADLVGKVEAGIPEDDPRNPAAIADNVGDNVGDVAGMGADLYESYCGSILATAALGAAAYASWGVEVQYKAVIAPMLIAAVGILLSIVGIFSVRAGEASGMKDLLRSLSLGTNLSSILILGGTFLILWLLQMPHWPLLSLAVVVGLLVGVVIGRATEYFTSQSYRPTRRLAESGKTGSATVIISGLGLGMMSTTVPVVAVVAGIILSYWLASGFDFTQVSQGLYGIGIASVGMLSTLGITFSNNILNVVIMGTDKDVVS